VIEILYLLTNEHLGKLLMNRKILIIDDDRISIRLLMHQLQQEGYTVLTEQNGAEGLKTANTAQPDLILMDIQMPVMDGMRAAHEIMANERTCRIPVIGMSAFDSPDTRKMALQVGMVGFFPKPINLEHVINQVQHYLPVDRK
jgi:CheY-like chemotaxis protein